MAKPLEVAIVGKSLILAGLAAGLKEHNKIRLTHLELPMVAAAAEMGLIAPDVIIFTVNDANAAGIGPLILRFPGIRLIGLEEEKASLVVITGSTRKVWNMNDLTQVITG